MKLLEVQLMLKRSTATRSTLAAAVDWTVKQLPDEMNYKPAQTISEVPPITPQNTTGGAAFKAEGAR